VLIGVAGFEPATPSSRTRCAQDQAEDPPRPPDSHVMHLLGPAGSRKRAKAATHSPELSAATLQRRRRERASLH
jgi:hypothetical protein